MQKTDFLTWVLAPEGKLQLPGKADPSRSCQLCSAGRAPEQIPTVGGGHAITIYKLLFLKAKKCSNFGCILTGLSKSTFLTQRHLAAKFEFQL